MIENVKYFLKCCWNIYYQLSDDILDELIKYLEERNNLRWVMLFGNSKYALMPLKGYSSSSGSIPCLIHEPFTSSLQTSSVVRVKEIT